MTAIAAQNLEKNAVVLRRKSAGCSDRRATDKYWGLFFIVVLIVWTAAALDVFSGLHDGHKSVEKFDSSYGKEELSEFHSSDSEKEKFNSPDIEKEKFYANSKNEKFDSNREKEYPSYLFESIEYFMHRCWGHSYSRFKRSVKLTVENANQVWGQNWIFDTILCNLAFLNKNYERSGSIVIWANVLLCFCLIAYSLASLNTNRMYRAIFPIFGLYLLYTAGCRCMMVFHLGNLDVTTLYWLIPELILLLLAVLYMSLSRTFNETISKETKNVEARFDFNSIRCILTTAAPGALYHIALALFGSGVYRPWLEKNLLYSFSGLICYVLLIAYYLMFMVLCCATGLALDRDRVDPRIRDFLRATFIVGRYHFGTACYHATIIVPKIRAALIMNEEEFKVIPIFSTIDRRYMMHFKVHDLSLIMAAVRGYDYSKSVRESLRLSTRDSPKPIKNCHPSLSLLFRCGAILSIAINNLMIVGFWACGVTLESSFVMQNCYMYIVGMFVTSSVVKIWDVWVDTDWLYSDENVKMKVIQTI